MTNLVCFCLELDEVIEDLPEVLFKAVNPAFGETLKEEFCQVLRDLDVSGLHSFIFFSAVYKDFAPVLSAALPADVSHNFEPVEHARQGRFFELGLLHKLVDWDAVGLPEGEHNPALRGIDFNAVILEPAQKDSLADLADFGHEKARLALLFHCLSHNYLNRSLISISFFVAFKSNGFLIFTVIPLVAPYFLLLNWSRYFLPSLLFFIKSFALSGK